jgi:hypothetical protein
MFHDKNLSFIESCLKQKKFIFGISNSTEIFRKIIKNSSKVYIIICNIDDNKILCIIKFLEFKNGEMIFEIKTKIEIYFKELLTSENFKKEYLKIFERNYDTLYLENLDILVNQLNLNEEVEIFFKIKDFIKKKYKSLRDEHNNNNNNNNNNNFGINNILYVDNKNDNINNNNNK